MKRIRPKRKDPLTGSPRRRSPSRREACALGPRDLGTLTKRELLALILEQQAFVPEPPTAGSAAPETLPVADIVPACEVPTAAARPGLMIDFSVRSGQTIEFPGGDVTVIGSVSSGAEIIAGGSIHVYGALRGRAIAGTSGDQNARIFCQDFDAELLCIDGRYRLADNVDRELRGRAVQARLEGSGMALVPLESTSSGAVENASRERVSSDKFRRATDRVRQLISNGITRDPTVPSAATRQGLIGPEPQHPSCASAIERQMASPFPYRRTS